MSSNPVERKRKGRRWRGKGKEDGGEEKERKTVERKRKGRRWREERRGEEREGRRERRVKGREWKGR